MTADRTATRLLLLGGTQEARELAAILDSDSRFSIISSLAGRTSQPEATSRNMRRGGFGGASGLQDFAFENDIDVIIDATHPFAETISINAERAARELGIAYMRLSRPAWQPRDGDNWTAVSDITDAAARIPSGATAFLTIGRQQISAFAARGDIAIVARMIEPPDLPLPDTVEIILARPPFSLDEEIATLKRHQIEILVTKNAGGEAVAAKLEAARQLGLPVIMVKPPHRATAGRRRKCCGHGCAARTLRHLSRFAIAQHVRMRRVV